MPGQRITRIATVIGAGAYLGSLVPGVRPDGGPSVFWDVGVYVGVSLLSATACATRVIRSERDRLAWLLIAVGLASTAAGTLVFNAVLLPAGNFDRPSPADALWLMLYPAAIVAIVLLLRARTAGFGASVWLDGVVSGLGLASLVATQVFPRVPDDAAGTGWQLATTLAFPVLDLALLITVVGSVTALSTWRDRSWMLLGAGFFTFAIADSWYLVQSVTGTYRQGSLVDFSYLAAATLIAQASKDRHGAERVRTVAGPGSRSLLMPGAFGLIAVGVLAVNATTPTPTVAIVLAVGALIAAWVRTALTVREVVMLTESRRLALTDTLTGLPNRRAFYQVLEAAEHGTSAEVPFPACVILADLDRFKEINDAIGHQLGDQLLREVSHRLAAEVSAAGTLARLGDDELALFVPGMTTGEAAQLSRRLLATLEEPFRIQDLSLHLTASIGITALEAGSQVSHALAKADLAMYRAKEAHTECEIYDDERDGDAWDRLSTAEDLREALATTGLAVEFQPICTLPDLTPVGVEALVRWHHPTRGRIAPDQFLPLAEKAGLMSAITRTVLDQSLDEAQRLRDRGWAMSVSVNLSASDLLDDNLVEHIELALRERELPGRALRIEITESLLVDTGAGAVDRLFRLRELGVDLAVDDYGTGYSCLAYLHDLPVSHLKIDRSFVDRMLKDDRTALIVASTIDMAHGLGLKVVAEGLETLEQQSWLFRHDCDLVQGYLLSRPVPAADLDTWLGRRQVPDEPAARSAAAKTC